MTDHRSTLANQYLRNIKSKPIERAAAEAVKRAYESLMEEILPAEMVFKIGTQTVEGKVYQFKVVVTMVEP